MLDKIIHILGKFMNILVMIMPFITLILAALLLYVIYY